jgi:hypothetical protein
VIDGHKDSIPTVPDWIRAELGELRYNSLWVEWAMLGIT